MFFISRLHRLLLRLFLLVLDKFLGKTPKYQQWRYGGGLMIRPSASQDEAKFMNIQCNVFHFLCKLNLIPFHWDPEELQFEKKTSKWNLRLWFCTVSLGTWAAFLFTLYRFIESLSLRWRHVQRDGLSEIVGLWTTLAFRSIVCVTTAELSTSTDIIVGVANQILKLRRDGTNIIEAI